MYFQGIYNWSSTHISDKLKMSGRETNKTESILFAVDFIKLTDILFSEYCHASNYSSHLRQFYRRLNPTFSSYRLSQHAVFYGTFLFALLTIPILSHIVFFVTNKKEKEQP